MMSRSYEQTCFIARSLDVLGERWTLLIVRELALGPRRYGDLLSALPGMGTSLWPHVSSTSSSMTCCVAPRCRVRAA